MTNIEKVKYVRGLTLSPINKVNEALAEAKGDVTAAVEILISNKQADANEMANRAANAKIVYSYVHNYRVGAMIVLACQTDFVAKTEAFLNLAKNICMHIVATPVAPEYVSKESIPEDVRLKWASEYVRETEGKPDVVRGKIIHGKIQKRIDQICLLNQKFVREDTVTIEQLIKDVSDTVGEKIEITYFVKVVAK